MEGLRRHVERLSTASGVTLRLEDLSTRRHKPGVWHAVLNESLARCERREVAWRTPAEALRALEAACDAHQKAATPPPLAQPPPPRPKQQTPAPPPPTAPKTAPRRRSPSPRLRRSRSPYCADRYKGLFGVTRAQAAVATLHVRHLPMDADAAEVARFFSRFGPLRYVVVPPPDLPAQRSGSTPFWRYASVTYMDWHGANAALKATNGQQLRLRRESLHMAVTWSQNAFMPAWDAPPSTLWMSPELARSARAADGNGGGRPRSRSRSRGRGRSRSRDNERGRSRDRGCSRYDDRRAGDAPPPRGRDEMRRRSSRSRSRSRGRDTRRHDNGRRREATPPPRDRHRGHGATPASQPPDAKQPKPRPALPQPPAAPAPSPLPLPPAAAWLHAAAHATSSAAPAAAPQVQYRSFMSTKGSAPPSVAAAPFAVVGTPLSGDPALPRPLALDVHWRASQVETLGAHLPAARLCVVAMSGENDAANAALSALANQLAAPAALPGGEACAAGVFSSDGAAHFFLPPSPEAIRLLAKARPGLPTASLTAAGIVVSFLLSDAAVAAAKNTRDAIVASLQASRPAATAQHA